MQCAKYIGGPLECVRGVRFVRVHSVINVGTQQDGLNRHLGLWRDTRTSPPTKTHRILRCRRLSRSDAAKSGYGQAALHGMRTPIQTFTAVTTQAIALGMIGVAFYYRIA